LFFIDISILSLIARRTAQRVHDHPIIQRLAQPDNTAAAMLKRMKLQRLIIVLSLGYMIRFWHQNNQTNPLDALLWVVRGHFMVPQKSPHNALNRGTALAISITDKLDPHLQHFLSEGCMPSAAIEIWFG